MATTEFFAGIPVTDFSARLGWYERLFGKPPDFLPHESEAVWQITEHAWVYVVADAERAGKALVTVLVDDLDAQIAQLAGRGVPIGQIEVIPDAARSVEITDPDGNKVKYGQPLA
jgi:catechol 2,3-dioxygenase-like lactoylglutathione lyase family enzyme